LAPRERCSSGRIIITPAQEAGRSLDRSRFNTPRGVQPKI
jgi:hypothetical protein